MYMQMDVCGFPEDTQRVVNTCSALLNLVG